MNFEYNFDFLQFTYQIEVLIRKKKQLSEFIFLQSIDKLKEETMFRIHPSQERIVDRLPPSQQFSNSNQVNQAQQQSSVGLKKGQQLNLEISDQVQIPNKNDLKYNVPKDPVNGIKMHQQPGKCELFTCRICLQEGPALHANTQQQLQNMIQKLQDQKKCKQPKYLITACKCQGTSGYVHQRCMIQWIDTQYKRSKQKQMKCQICLIQILYDRKIVNYFQCTCRNLQQISHCNIACFGSIIAILAVFIAIQVKSNDLSLNMLSKITVFILMGIMGIALIFSLAFIIKEAFYKHKKQTVKIYSNDQIDICGIRKSNLSHYELRSSTHRTQTNIRSVRSIRSAQSIGQRQGQRQNQRQRQTESRTQRNSRNSRSARNHNTNQQNARNPPGSARQVRVVRQPNSTRSIQIRSRQNIQDPHSNN